MNFVNYNGIYYNNRLNIDQNPQGAGSVDAPEQPADPEVGEKVREVIAKLQNGGMSVEEALAILNEAGIFPEITHENGKTILKFEFEGNNYTIYTNSDNLENNPEEPSPTAPHSSEGERTAWENIDFKLVYGQQQVFAPKREAAAAVAVAVDNTTSTEGTSGTCNTGGTNGTDGVVEADGVSSAAKSAMQTKISNAVEALRNGDITPLQELKNEYGDKIEISVEKYKDIWALSVKIQELDINMSWAFINDISSAVNTINSVVETDETTSTGGPGGTDGVGDKTPLQAFEERITGSEFDKEVTRSEAMTVINEFFDLLRADLKEKYGFSDDFKNAIFNFAVSELEFNNSQAATFGQANEQQYNLKSLLISVKKDIESLTGEAVYWKTRTELTTDTSNATNDWCEDEFIQSDSYLNDTLFTSLFIRGNYYVIGEADDPYNKQNKFLRDLFSATFNNLNLNSYDEQEAFMNVVINTISEKIGVPSGEITPKDIMTKLNSNNNASWIDEIVDIVNQVSSNVKMEGIDNAAKIDTKALMGENDSIDAKYISDKLADFKFSNDPGTRKFSDIIQDALSKFNIYNNYDELELLNAIITLLNNKCGVENTNPPTITREALEKLNENGIFEVLKDVINSEELIEEYYFGSVDGEIGFYGQGGTGDCWLLAGINALNASSIGQQIIKDSIKDNGDGTYTVTLKGVNRSYTFTKEDIMNAVKSSAYSHGDKDAILLELAVEKVHQEVINGTLNLPLLGSDFTRELTFDGAAIEGGSENWLVYYLTGNTSYNCSTHNEHITYTYLETIYDDFKNGKIGLGLEFNPNGYTIINGVAFISSHAYTVVDMTIAEPSDPSKNTITIVNPWYSDIKCTVTWEEFMNIGALGMEVLNIGGVDEPQVNAGSYVDDLFDKLEKGKISSSYLHKEISSIDDNYLTEQQKEEIIKKWLLFYTEGLIDIADWPYPPVGGWDSGNHTSNSMNFKYNGTTFNVSKGTSGSKSYFYDDIFKYSKNLLLIYIYFEVAATANGQPLIFRLRAGKTFEDFINAAT